MKFKSNQEVRDACIKLATKKYTSKKSAPEMSAKIKRLAKKKLGLNVDIDYKGSFSNFLEFIGVVYSPIDGRTLTFSA